MTPAQLAALINAAADMMTNHDAKVGMYRWADQFSVGGESMPEQIRVAADRALDVRFYGVLYSGNHAGVRCAEAIAYALAEADGIR